MMKLSRRSLAVVLASAGSAFAVMGQARPETLDVPSGPVASSGGLVQDYCSAFVDEAKKARESREKTELLALKDQVDAKLKELSDKTAVLSDWVQRREAILANATDAIVKIYKVMDPAAAAVELSKLDEVTASAIIRKLDAKRASAILVELDPKKAALIIAIMASDSNLKKDNKS